MTSKFIIAATMCLALAQMAGAQLREDDDTRRVTYDVAVACEIPPAWLKVTKASDGSYRAEISPALNDGQRRCVRSYLGLK
jgi:hypothetical protein